MPTVSSKLSKLVSPIALVLLAGCAGASHGKGVVGSIRLALSSGTDDRSYRLREGTFVLDGPMPLELSSESALDSPVLTQSMPVGSYEMTLLDGWRLELVENAVGTEVSATLASMNPVNFDVEEGATTQVNYRFQTAGQVLTLGDGSLSLGIEVDEVALRRVVITEIMKDPSVLLDTAGEWFEIHNPGDMPVELEGCNIVRDTAITAITSPLSIAAGGYVTLARTPEPGFAPDYMLPGLTLPNAAPVLLAVECAGAVLDQVIFDATSFPTEPGKSLSLSPASLDTFSNDIASSWCAGQESYNGDLGTPGSPNTVCP